MRAFSYESVMRSFFLVFVIFCWKIIGKKFFFVKCLQNWLQDVNDKQTRKKVDNVGGDDKKRSVKIDLTQKTGALPDGTSNVSS